MNMFILPKEIGGLGETQEFIDKQKKLNNQFSFYIISKRNVSF